MSLALHTGTIDRRPVASFATSISVREIVALAWKQRWKALLAALVPPAAAAAALLVMTPMYRAQSDLLVKTGREYLAPADANSSGMTAPTSTKQEGINSEVALLTSRAVVKKTIDDIGMTTIYPGIGTGLLAELFPSGGTLMDAAIDRFGKDLSVDPVKLSNIISVSFDFPDPERAKVIVDQLIRNYLAKHTEVFAGDRAESYEDSINHAIADIHALEEQRSKIKLSNGIYDIAAQRAALISQRVDAQARLMDVQSRQAILQQRLAYLTATRPRVANLTQSNTTDKADESVHAREALADLRQAEAALAARYGDRNPDLQRLRQQIAVASRTASTTASSRTSTVSAPSPLAQQIDQELIMANAELAPLQGEIARYEANLAGVNQELSRIEKADLALRTTVSRIDALNDNLKGMQGRYEQARTQEQTDLARQVSVVQVAKADASDKPAKPKRMLFILGGVLGSVLFAGGVMVLGVLFTKTLITVDAAERLIGLPVLAALPMLKQGRGTSVAR